MDIQRLEELLREERGERSRLEKDKLRREKEILEERRERERGGSITERLQIDNKKNLVWKFSGTSDKDEHLEQEVLQYREQISVLQDKLDSVSKVFDMSVEDLSDTLLQIKAFRMQQESRAGLDFLWADGQVEPHELANIQAVHAETVLELQKTRNLLLLEHRISKDLQEELKTVIQKLGNEREEMRRRMTEKNKLLSKKALQINALQAQLKELAYSPRNYKRTVPLQYTWPAGNQELVQPIDEDLSHSQIMPGESLLEIHLKAATFTPAGLRTLGSICGEDIVTFCTYSLLDFEVHSTPLVSGCQPEYGFTSRYALTARDLGRLGGQGSRVRVELHQGLGGVRFVTHGSGQMSLMTAMERRGECIVGRVNITDSDGAFVGVVDFWVRLFDPAEPERASDRRTTAQRGPGLVSLGWQDAGHQELYDYGGGIPNELVVVVDRCVGLNSRWPGLLPDAYLTYRFYDLPPHVSPTVRSSADPVFSDSTSYPLAVSADVLHYLRSSSLWLYVFDDSDDQIPPAYLAKTPIPLRTLATGREIRGDFVLRDPAGGPRGMVRVLIKWKFPYQPSADTVLSRQDRGMESTEREERGREEAEASERPVAKPRVKNQLLEEGDTKAVQKEPKALARPPPVKQNKSQSIRLQQPISVKPLDTGRKRSTKRSPDLYHNTPHLTPEPRPTTPSLLATRKSSPTTPSKKSSASDARTQDLLSVDHVSMDEEERSESAAKGDGEAPDSSASSSSTSDIIIIPPQRQIRKGDKLRVEILSLSFEPSSHVVKDKSVQRVYVEYRLLGVPMETTETPMSLRKPRKGEEVHYNFTRVIYVDGSQSAPLRQYLYTMLEGTDPNQGRLKFTVVSEPMDDEDECVDVGHAFLDLKELLLTGNDVNEQEIEVVSLDEDKEKEDDTDDEEKQEEEKKKDDILIDYDDDSDF
ncbi:X-linked retinitis pigmentosa GTPase regulator-interacting protein 1 [Dissostichus eleginoides]|uniref:X-linked retinitis pigmentosa GTPase regulator-interacting protein 1 n=1 Tax=Dissostichus eleginoides TaxID=100907 RepID=A0AAD9BVA3_DISEL|nr:X-linked retinitis pigmentosa GTPase regulator-interacting protein 1 [Dissostichus eleginoides]